ncbi:hypothetical protein JCM9279_007085 [Rhodotorula babjevae]
MAVHASLAHLFDPEPSFEVQLNRLDKQCAIHPHFLPIDGGPFDSDDERDLLAIQNAAWGRAAPRGRTASHKSALSARAPQRKARRPTPPRPPPPPAPAPAPVLVQPRPAPSSSVSDDIVLDDTTDQDGDDDAPMPVQAPARPVKRARAEVVELSLSDESDDDGDEQVQSGSSSPPAPRSGTLVRAATGAELRRRQRRAAQAAPAAAAPAPAAGRGRPAKKARASLNLDQALQQVASLNRTKLVGQFPTISSFVEHLAQYERAPGTRPRLLDGCRVVFINTDHWSNSAPRKNRFDEALRLNMIIAARNGATLVKPADFTPAPFDVDDGDVSTAADELAARAEAEGWTTYIVPLEPAHKHRPATYEQVLGCLGPDDGEGIEQDELGPFVKVVRFEWISKCVDASAKLDEGDFVLGGDFREGARRERRDKAALEDELRRKRKAREREKSRLEKEDPSKGRRQGARERAADAGEDTQRESDDDDDENTDAVSPLGPDDWPPDEAPAPGYFDQPRSQSTAASSIPKRDKGKGKAPREVVAEDDIPDRRGFEDSSDPIDDPDRTRTLSTGAPLDQDADAALASPEHPLSRADSGTFVYEGLEEEHAIIQTLGAEAVDRFNEVSASDLLDLDPNAVLSMRAPDDNATDDEDSQGEIQIKRKPKKKPPKGWTCDNPAASRQRQDGPNEVVAKTLELLAGLIPKIVDKDEFRIRSHQKAANLLRSYEDKIDSYEELVQIRGIGPKLAHKVVEIARTGTHRRLSKFETDADKAEKLFGEVYGVKKVAQDLWAKGARSIDDLRSDPQRYGITRPAVLIGLEYYEDLLERIPRQEVTEIVERVKNIARKIDPELQVDCMGSWRRGAESSGDIDLLVTRDPSKDGKTHEGLVKKLWKKMKEAGIAQYELSLPKDDRSLDAKINGLCKLPGKDGAKMRRIDVLGVPWEEMPAALIYFSSGSIFNRSLRLKARRMGYRLNQRGLYKDVMRDRKGVKLTEGVLVKGVKSERDIFRILNVRYRPPEERSV